MLANKTPLSRVRDFAPFGAHFTQQKLGCRATLGAGLPVVSALRDLQIRAGFSHRRGKRVFAISGCFSGSLGTLFTQMEEQAESRAKGLGGKEWSELVLAARVEGKTEPDPRKDLSGGDVAAKIFIIARLCGFDVLRGVGPPGKNEDEPGQASFLLPQSEFRRGGSAVDVESLVSEAAAAMSLEAFLAEGLARSDAEMRAKFETLHESGAVLRFVGEISTKEGDEVVCSAKPLVLSSDSVLSALRGAEKAIEFVFEDGSSELIRGGGAGGANAAKDVFTDLLELCTSTVMSG